MGVLNAALKLIQVTAPRFRAAPRVTSTSATEGQGVVAATSPCLAALAQVFAISARTALRAVGWQAPFPAAIPSRRWLLRLNRQTRLPQRLVIWVPDVPTAWDAFTTPQGITPRI